MTLSLVIPKTLTELFAHACSAYGREPSDELFSAWRAALHGVPVRDLYDAFLHHQQNTALDPRDGRPIGRWFPTPAELLAHVEARRRSAGARRVKRGYCGREDCLGGFIRVGASMDGSLVVDRCPHCAALWATGG